MHIYNLQMSEVKEVDNWQELEQLLNMYKTIFKEPTSLPPVRHQDH